jgi:hypothetical protein
MSGGPQESTSGSNDPGSWRTKRSETSCRGSAVGRRWGDRRRHAGTLFKHWAPRWLRVRSNRAAPECHDHVIEAPHQGCRPCIVEYRIGRSH